MSIWVEVEKELPSKDCRVAIITLKNNVEDAYYSYSEHCHKDWWASFETYRNDKHKDRINLKASDVKYWAYLP